jgi:hypothetical protein
MLCRRVDLIYFTAGVESHTKGDETKDNGLGTQNGGHQTANGIRRAL